MTNNELIIHNLTQGTDEWLEARKAYVTGSEMANLYGTNPFLAKRIDQREHLMLQKLGMITFFMNNAMKEGHIWEDHIVKHVETVMDCKTEPLVASRGQIMASFDGVNFETGHIIEVKNSEYSYKKLVKGEVSPNYMWQLQVQMYVAGLDTAYFAVRNPKTEDILIQTVKATPTIYPEMLKRVSSFLADFQDYTPNYTVHCSDNSGFKAS